MFQHYIVVLLNRMTHFTEYFIISEGCETGSYYNVTQDSCTPCPIGMYQNDSGEHQCKTCPTGYSTVSAGARNLSSCIGILYPYLLASLPNIILII